MSAHSPQVWESYDPEANGNAETSTSDGATEPESTSVTVTHVSEAGLFHVQVTHMAVSGMSHVTDNHPCPSLVIWSPKSLIVTAV